MLIRRDIEWDFIDALAAVKLDTTLTIRFFFSERLNMAAARRPSSVNNGDLKCYQCEWSRESSANPCLKCVWSQWGAWHAFICVSMYFLSVPICREYAQCWAGHARSPGILPVSWELHRTRGPISTRKRDLPILPRVTWSESVLAARVSAAAQRRLQPPSREEGGPPAAVAPLGADGDAANSPARGVWSGPGPAAPGLPGWIRRWRPWSADPDPAGAPAGRLGDGAPVGWHGASRPLPGAADPAPNRGGGYTGQPPTRATTTRGRHTNIYARKTTTRPHQRPVSDVFWQDRQRSTTATGTAPGLPLHIWDLGDIWHTWKRHPTVPGIPGAPTGPTAPAARQANSSRRRCRYAASRGAICNKTKDNIKPGGTSGDPVVEHRRPRHQISRHRRDLSPTWRLAGWLTGRPTRPAGGHHQLEQAAFPSRRPQPGHVKSWQTRRSAIRHHSPCCMTWASTSWSSSPPTQLQLLPSSTMS